MIQALCVKHYRGGAEMADVSIGTFYTTEK
jgi:hypothetical protein